ncbi:MAG: class I SAM-dependent methyltransferase [Clostridiales bacterium]|nr:class I SAM-dependent methyltransferase [Clostridiales bacterium]
MEYDVLSAFYDRLVNADYAALYAYYRAIWARYGCSPEVVLDLGCGTGNLLPHLEQAHQVIGVDISAEMLSAAREKAAPETLLLQQDMRALDLYGTVDAAVCALDGINALEDGQAVLETLSRVNLFLSKGGLFVFDVNTPYKFRQVLDGAAFVYDTEEVYCVWQSALQGKSCAFWLDFFVPDGRGRYERRQEALEQRVYELEELEQLVARSGLELLAVLGDHSLEPPGPQEQRVFFVTRKGRDAPNQ